MRHPLVAFLVLWAAVFAVYGVTARYGAIAYDDFSYLPVNQPPLFTGLFTDAVVNLWHPLTVLSHRLTQAVFSDYYGAHHLLNVFLHGSASSLLFLWLFRATRRWELALACALLWSIHPLAVEPVAWISGRKDVLFAVLLFGGFAAITHPRGRLAAPCLLGLAYLSKPTAVVIPALIFACGFWPGWGHKAGARWARNLMITLIGASVVLAGLTVYFQSSGGQSVAPSVAMSERASGALWAIGEALQLWLVPFQMHLGYENPSSVSILRLALTSLLLFVALLLGWHWRKQYPHRTAGIAWFLIPLLPTLGLLHAGNSLVADRYLYLPSLGLLFLVVPILFSRPKLFPFALITVTGLVLVLGFLAHRQVQTWRDTASVFQHILTIDPGHTLAHSKLGERLVLESGDEQAARDHLGMALKRRPDDPGAHLSLGILEAREGQYELAISHYEQTLRVWPHMAWIHANLAGCYWASGQNAVGWDVLKRAPVPKGDLLWLHRERLGLVRAGENHPRFLEESLRDLRQLRLSNPDLGQEIEKILQELYNQR